MSLEMQTVLERALTRRQFLREVLQKVKKVGEIVEVAAIDTVIIPPLFRLDSTLRILDALAGNGVNCSDIEPNLPPVKVDAFIVPGAGLIKIDGKYEPNEDGKIRLESAAIAYKNGWTSRIILLNGFSKSEEERVASENYFFEIFQRLKSVIPFPFGENFIVEYDSINTATSAIELKEIAQKYHIKSSITVSTGQHPARAAELECTQGVPTYAESAEKVLLFQERTDDPSNMDTRREDMVRNVRVSKPAKMWEHIKEGGKLAFTIYDPEGEISTYLRRRGYFLP